MKSDAICCPVSSYATTTSALISVCARLVPGVRSPMAVPVAAARNARRSIDIEFRSMALLPKCPLRAQTRSFCDVGSLSEIGYDAHETFVLVVLVMTVKQ